MTELDVADRQRLVRTLSGMPALATERSRRDLLVLAGHAPAVDVSGDPAEAVTRIVHHLARHGRGRQGPHALGLFLNVVRGFADQEQEAVLAGLLADHDLMVPVVRAPGIGTWHGTTTDPAAAPSHPVAFLSAAVAVARCVAHVVVTTAARSWSGTGFLVGPDLVLTAGHVLPRADLALTTTFRFNHQLDAEGRPERHDDYAGAPGGLFHTSRDLDYTLVRLAGRPGDRWTYLPLTAETPAVSDRVGIVGHPAGQPKRIAVRDNVVAHVGDGVVQYLTPGLPSPSGAPVFTDEWRVCAVQRAAAPDPAPGTFRNEGTATSAILRDLPAPVRSVLPAGGVTPGRTW